MYFEKGQYWLQTYVFITVLLQKYLVYRSSSSSSLVTKAAAAAAAVHAVGSVVNPGLLRKLSWG